MPRVVRSSLPLLAVLSLLLLTASVSFAQVRAAPINPAYVEYLDQLARGTWKTVTEDGHGLGEIPHPVLPPTGPVRIDLPMAPPASYDLRSIGSKVPAIRDQGACGSCWAFATFASMETCARPTNTWDFSENHMKNLHGWDWTCCAGGNPWVSSAYLSRWGGPVWESDDGYNPSLACPGSPGGLSPRRHVQNVNWLPRMTSGTDTTNRNIIQNEIVNNGGVYVNYYTSSTYYYKAPAGSTAFYHPSATSTNHGVCIIGWDNNYASTNFLPATQPPGNGAWLVRNSWGNTWPGNGGSTVGDSGYFWASYYDAQLAKATTYGVLAQFQNTRPTTNYTGQCSYDPLGWITNYNMPYAANIFTRSGGYERLDAVGYYTCYPGDSVSISVYKNCTTTDPTNGTLVASHSGSPTFAGYHTASLATPPTFGPSDTRFSIVTYITGGAFPSAAEKAIATVSSGATANPGESFYSWTGGVGSWVDMQGVDTTANFCIKGLTNGLPSLEWAGTTGYTTDGVNPNSGNPDSDASPTTFTFKVKYTDATGATPLKARCIISKKECKAWKLQQNVAMTKESGSIATGAIYSVATTLPNRVYKYRFLFQSGGGVDAVGTPNNHKQGPNITARPILCWTGTTGYTTDGVEPNSGPTGKFVYKVYYMDSAGNAPTTREVVLNCDGSFYKKGTMNTYGGDYRLGRCYTKTMWLCNGSHQYRFRFQDASGYAGGDPATWQSGPSISSSSSSAVTAVAAVPTKAGAQVTFTLSDAADVTATVMNVAGRPVKTLVTDKPLDAGIQTLVWDGKAGSGLAAPAGLYLIRVTARTEGGGQSSAMATLALR